MCCPISCHCIGTEDFQGIGSEDMKARELKRMRRSDLLEMLLQMRKENDRLRQELDEVRQKLNSRHIAIEECGSLAEAVVKLNGLMEATQTVCDQYTYNVKLRCEEAEEQCRLLEKATKKKCDQMLLDTVQRVDTMQKVQNQRKNNKKRKK